MICRRMQTKRTGTTRGYKQAPGQRLPGTTGSGGWLSRLYLLFTGFPFPLGPLLFRQTYRYEERLLEAMHARLRRQVMMV